MRIFVYILLFTIIIVSELRAESPALTCSMDDLSRANYRYIGDLLDHLPGLWARDLGSVGQWSGLRMSGASSRGTVICVNGIPIQDAWTMETDLNWIAVDLIDSVQVYPSGNPLGLSAPGGLINLVIEDETVPRPESVFHYRTGSLGFSDLDLNFYQSITSDISYGFGALVTKYAQEISSRSFEKQNLRGLVAIRLMNRIDFKYRLLMNKLHTSIPDLFYFPAGQQSLTSPFRKTDRSDHFFDTEGNVINIHNRIQIHLSETDFEYRQRNHTEKQTYPVKSATVHFNQDYSALGLPIQLGLWNINQSLSMPDSGKQETSEYRLYTNTDFSLFGPLGFNGSVNCSKRDHVPVIWYGNVHLIWTSGNKGSVRIGGALESRTPNLGEVFNLPISHGPEETVLEYELYTKAMNHYLSSDLNPEKSRIADVILQFQNQSWLSAYCRFFYRQTTDLIQFSGDITSPQLVNTGQHDFYGVETSSDLGPFYGFKLQGTVNFIQPKDENGNFLPERPNIWGSTAISWSRSFFEDDLNVFFRLGTKFRSEFWCLYGEELALVGRAGQVLEFKTILTFLQNADVFFSMDNLLDAYLFRVNGYPIANRSYRYGIKWKVFD